jgi:hypothetical protein
MHASGAGLPAPMSLVFFSGESTEKMDYRGLHLALFLVKDLPKDAEFHDNGPW